MKKSLKKCGNWFKSIPWYGVAIGLLLTLGFQTLMYYIGCAWVPHVSGMWYGIDPQIPAIDSRIPLIPHFFALLYQGWYVIFPIGVILSSTKITLGKNKEEWINWLISCAIATFLGGLVLIFFPTFIDRYNVAGVPGGDIYVYVESRNSFWWQIEKAILSSHQQKEFGCLPSFHCLQIIFCYFGAMGKKDKNIVHRLAWLLIAILTCMSTLFVKQHYIIDVFAAVSLAAVCFFGVKLFNPGAAMLKKWPNFLIIKKINWSHEKIFTKHQTTKLKIKNKKQAN